MEISGRIHYLVQDYVPVSHIGDVIIAQRVLWVEFRLKEAYLVIPWAIQRHDGVGFIIKDKSNFCKVNFYDVGHGEVFSGAGVFFNTTIPLALGLNKLK